MKLNYKKIRYCLKFKPLSALSLAEYSVLSCLSALMTAGIVFNTFIKSILKT